MILCIADVLDAEALEEIGRELADARFVDGRATAGWSARLVKDNLQLARDDPAYERIVARIEAALGAQEVFTAAALPKTLRPPLISRTDVGMGYGTHVDDALMGTPPIRTDLAYTLFLTSPEDYEGGALVIESAAGEADYRLPAGSLVLYPATFLHRVEPVTAGSRLVAAGWVQSCVREADRRDLLFDLQRARRQVFAAQGKGEAFDLLSRVHGNLLRLWADA